MVGSARRGPIRRGGGLPPYHAPHDARRSLTKDQQGLFAMRIRQPCNEGICRLCSAGSRRLCHEASGSLQTRTRRLARRMHRLLRRGIRRRRPNCQPRSGGSRASALFGTCGFSPMSPAASPVPYVTSCRAGTPALMARVLTAAPRIHWLSEEASVGVRPSSSVIGSERALPFSDCASGGCFSRIVICGPRRATPWTLQSRPEHDIRGMNR